jgi:hypothetical protein
LPEYGGDVDVTTTGWWLLKTAVPKSRSRQMHRQDADATGSHSQAIIIARNLLFHPFGILVTLGPREEGVQ